MTSARICSRCVMDSSNPQIVFDEEGICNCCTDAVARMPVSNGRRRQAPAAPFPKCAIAPSIRTRLRLLSLLNADLHMMPTAS